LNVKTLIIVAMATLLGLLSACGQGSSPATDTAPPAVVEPAEPATQQAAPVVADPVAGTPTPPAE